MGHATLDPSGDVHVAVMYFPFSMMLARTIPIPSKAMKAVRAEKLPARRDLTQQMDSCKRRRAP